MNINYDIIRSCRKTIAIQIQRDGRVIVRCPNRMSEREIGLFVQSKSNWICKHISKFKEKDAEKLNTEEIAFLRKQTAELVHKRVEYFAAIIGVSYNRVSVRVQRSRWGSCSSKKNLNFNCLLALVPADVLDYVVVHELCHLKQMNHSARFWSEVRKVLPDYELSKRWLREHGGLLLSRIE